MANFYDLEATKPNGQTFSFNSLRGRVILIVNTASKCGFTPQCESSSSNNTFSLILSEVEELEDLNEKYNEKGLTILGCRWFPCAREYIDTFSSSSL